MHFRLVHSPEYANFSEIKTQIYHNCYQILMLVEIMLVEIRNYYNL